jgi:hypothetical protein
VTFSGWADLDQPLKASTYVDNRALSRVFDGTAQDLVGKRRRVPFTKKDVPHHVHDRVDIGPVKVGVRDTSGGLLQVNEKRGNGIGNSSARGTEDTVGTITDPVDL